ncbi:uncharacterized protein PHACADRAFT_91769 [Phanerochaete carnosa HHB-10118-sp]|uniref:Histidinol-phosphatase n=1 Tax=Phanerochaete carnosa (strain HHB-10118-sp) TaxID=650164 RepID=K5VYW4_PHACS|nr:uncharacterized protein PHACADRAFT_91769 [Phanerochaete carnosa HHB-10118-sp]EKM56773.1 hypothetical protein PHACADRAFT_91769 [Phanerochaete carnosa HHB-10118-sp]
MPYSHHSHSGQFCKHASGSLEDVVLEAIRQGFEVYGLTEHVPRYHAADLYPEEEGVTPEDLLELFDHFVAEAHRLKDKYAGQILLLVGLETEHITSDDLDHLDALLSRYREKIQYLVGSVHHVNGLPIDFDRPTFEKAVTSFGAGNDQTRTEAFLCEYFDLQYSILTRFKPEIVGHIDLCRLYTPELRFAGYPQAHAKLERNIAYAVGYGALFELNAAALRKGWATAYPGEDVVELVKSAGGRFALSDDSHGPHAVGLNYGWLSEYARQMKICSLSVLTEAETPNASGRYVRARLAPERWWEHPFWSNVAQQPKQV